MVSLSIKTKRGHSLIETNVHHLPPKKSFTWTLVDQMKPQQAIDHILNRLEKELPEHLYYHGHRHTLDVMRSAKVIAASEKITSEQSEVLMVAAAYHDCGFLTQYQNHEEEGCKIARESLPEFGFDQATIDQICEMIMATKVPQQPRSKLAEVLCDADLDYLGTDRFSPIGDQLFHELIYIKAISDRETWDKIQLKFLSAHKYFTRFGKEQRQPTKEMHIENLKELLGVE